MDDAEILHELRNLSAIQFEHFIADFYEKQGYETKVTQAKGDGGVDVIARRTDGVTERVVGVQAKRYGEGNKVQARDVREYSWVSDQADIDQLDVVTTSEFTAGAKNVAKESRVELIDGEKLIDSIQKTDSFGILRRYTGSDAIPDTESTASEDRSGTGSGESSTGIAEKVVNGIVEGAQEFFSDPLGEYDTEAIYDRADEIEQRTYLSGHDAIVVAGAEAGLSDGEIGSLIGRSAGNVRDKRARLRRERRELAGEGENVIDLLESV